MVLQSNVNLNLFYDVIPSDIQNYIFEIRKSNRLIEIKNALKDLFKVKRNEQIFFKENITDKTKSFIKHYLNKESVVALINAEYVFNEYEDPPMLINYYEKYWGSDEFKSFLKKEGLHFEWYCECWGIISIDTNEKINADLNFEKKEYEKSDYSDSDDEEDEKNFKEELMDKLIDKLYNEFIMDARIDEAIEHLEKRRKLKVLNELKIQKKQNDNDYIKTIRWERIRKLAEKEKNEKDYVYNKLKIMFKDKYLDSKEFKYIVNNDEIIEFIILKDNPKF